MRKIMLIGLVWLLAGAMTTVYAKDVKIGVLTALSGNAANAGKHVKAAVELAVQIINQAHPELGNLPLASSPASPPPLGDVIYGIGRIDASGRIADRTVICALGWRNGDRLTLTADAGVVVARRDPGGMITVPARPYIAIPAALRRRCGPRAGDRALLAALPFESSAQTWGEELYFAAPVQAKLEPGARQVVEPGTACFWVEGGALALPYGPTPISTDGRPKLVTRCNVLGRIVGDARALAKVHDGDRIVVEGG